MSKNVEALAALLQQPIETVKIAFEAEGGLVDRISAFKQDYTVINRADKETLVKNAKEEGKSELLADFKPELLAKKDINRLVAWKLEEIESELKDRYGFDGEFRGTLDLVDKIVKTKSGNSKQDPNDKDEIDKLKKKIEEVIAEKESSLIQAKQETDNYIVTTEFERGISGLPLDYEQEAIEKQRKLLKDSFNASYEIKRKDSKMVVYKKGSDEFVMDEKRDPIPISTVIETHAKDYGFKLKSLGRGGQGGSSSSTTTNKFTGMSEEKFYDYLKDNGINKFSSRADEIRKDWLGANKT